MSLTASEEANLIALKKTLASQVQRIEEQKQEQLQRQQEATRRKREQEEQRRRAERLEELRIQVKVAREIEEEERRDEEERKAEERRVAAVRKAQEEAIRERDRQQLNTLINLGIALSERDRRDVIRDKLSWAKLRKRKLRITLNKYPEKTLWEVAG